MNSVEDQCKLFKTVIPEKINSESQPKLSFTAEGNHR